MDGFLGLFFFYDAKVFLGRSLRSHENKFLIFSKFSKKKILIIR